MAIKQYTQYQKESNISSVMSSLYYYKQQQSNDLPKIKSYFCYLAKKKRLDSFIYIFQR
jgi:hypothetical protein